MSVKQRVLYPDILRVVAIIAVASLHIANGDLAWLHPTNDFEWWITSMSYDAVFKWGTAVFVMISGAFMLSSKQTQDVGNYLKKRVSSILFPALIWMIFYKLIVDKWYINFSLQTIINLGRDIFFLADVQYHLWFIYMITFLYLITPLLYIVVNNAPKKMLEYYFVVWLIITVIPILIEYFFQRTNTMTAFTHVQLNKFVGFYIFGYYLHKYPIKLPKYVFLLIPISMGLNVYCSYLLSESHGKTQFLFYDRLSVFNILNALLIFQLFRQITWEKYITSLKVQSFLSTMAQLTYGVFLCHIFFMWCFDKEIFGFRLVGFYFYDDWIKPYLGYPMTISAVTISSFLFCYIVSKIPILKKILL